MSGIDIGSTTLSYRLEGPPAGEVVMLAGSLASDLTMWEPQIAALRGAGFRVLRYDHRGHGASAVPPGPYRIEDLADDALRLLDALGIDRVHLCGLSMGGMVGQLLGAGHPDRLASLVLCDTAAHMPPPEVWEARIAAVRAGGMEAVAEATIERWFTPAGRERLAEEVARIRAMVVATPVEGFCACCAAIRDMDLRERIGAITVPTLVVVGEHDPGTPVAAAEQIQRAIGGSRLEVIPGAAHFVNVEQAAAFNALLLGFLAEQAGR